MQQHLIVDAYAVQQSGSVCFQTQSTSRQTAHSSSERKGRVSVALSKRFKLSVSPQKKNQIEIIGLLIDQTITSAKPHRRRLLVTSRIGDVALAKTGAGELP